MSSDQTLANLIADLVVRIYTIHDTAIAKSGGMEGLRDGAMLHAAIARPFATFGGEDLYPDDFEKAAALFHSQKPSLYGRHKADSLPIRTLFLRKSWPHYSNVFS